MKSILIDIFFLVLLILLIKHIAEVKFIICYIEDKLIQYCLYE